MLPVLWSCGKEKPTKAEIADYVTSNPLVFTRSYIVSRNIIQDYRDLDGKPSKAIFPIQASVSASINLSKIRGISIDEEKNMATILLPAPIIRIKLSDAEINNALYCTNVNRSTFFQTEVQDFLPQAEELVKESLLKSDIPTQIQQDAAFALAAMMLQPKFKNMDYQIEVVKYNKEELLNLIVQ